LRVAKGQGASIEIEVWALPEQDFGRLVASTPAPLSIGTVILAEGHSVKGFLLEAAAAQGARDISSFGGWRNYLAQEKAPA
jgi:allophanate hydrolase